MGTFDCKRAHNHQHKLTKGKVLPSLPLNFTFPIIQTEAYISVLISAILHVRKKYRFELSTKIIFFKIYLLRDVFLLS